ncbi:hypothetical protein DESUT3_06820 [Desulfuromonas versatilis]|uniref:Rhombosortase n=1 Tax=Desulfuromonas versatilis TaxID=2802975 RepID=A0ABM8HSI2_9BACT|nr:hypothetical protein DESUT3_06820 [Desulfuromonas versatilis]
MVHVSLYHLLLDGSAFLLLYRGLDQPRGARRLFYLAATGLGSLLLPLAVSTEIYRIGLCGLSGIAHGLLGITALELLAGQPRRSTLHRGGALLLVGLTAKCLLEMITGEVLFAGLHFGTVGTPLVATHAGGLLGGLVGHGLPAALKGLRSDTMNA